MSERRTAPAPRHGAVDPVKALMHRHRDLCERAVDPLEIAAALEAHGVTDRTATRFRHRDVFSLAEEMYARVPRDTEPATSPPPPTAPDPRPAGLLRGLLFAALAAAAVTALHLTGGEPRLLLTAAALFTAALALRGTLSATKIFCLLAYAALGDGVLRAVLAGGPDSMPTGPSEGSWPIATAPLLALAPAGALATWCTHLFTSGARRRLAASRGLEDFTSAVRPLLLGVIALFLTTLTALLIASSALLGEPAAHAQTLTLGALLLMARLLAAHGRNHAPALVLTAAVASEATAVASLLASRLPGCAFLATPVETVVEAWGPAAVPALSCGAAALTLLIHATRTLTRASAHARPEGPGPKGP
ncbi:hypothetical protein [Streptomyces broussonetiae]|uniref:Integral membrane protein n=1 Tax=Streptomyces broussonetiae TaxID=2686304 RepID=A0ABV5E680_9ACTN